jgi:hypothetical protein
MSIRTLAAGLAAVGLIASIPAGASAAKLSRSVDPDRDGLSTKTEKRIGTKARKADTDRDGLKDGREVRLGSNPLKADTDGNGVRDGRQLRRGDHPCGPAVLGTVVSVGSDSVTITAADGTQKTITANSATVLRGITDRDGSGAVTIADLQAGDKVIVRTSADDPNLATMIGIKGAGKANEVEGSVAEVGTDSLTLTLADGSTKTLTVDSSTEFKGPDRDASGTVTLADIVAGDKVEAHVSATDPNLATEVKVEGTKVWGTVTAIGSDSVTVTTAIGSSVTATVTATTKFKVPDTDGSGTPGLSDLTVGQQIGMVTVDSGGTTVALAIGGDRGGHGGRGPRGSDDGAPRAGAEAGDDRPRGGRGPRGDRGPRGERGPRGARGPRED